MNFVTWLYFSLQVWDRVHISLQVGSLGLKYTLASKLGDKVYFILQYTLAITYRYILLEVSRYFLQNKRHRDMIWFDFEPYPFKMKLNDIEATMIWFWTISISWFQWHDPEAGMNTNGMYALHDHDRVVVFVTEF